MLRQEAVELLSTVTEGGIVTDENREDMQFLAVLLDMGRQVAITQTQRGARKGRLNSVCYQKHWPEYESVIQDNDCYVKFKCPPVVNITEAMDGFSFVGPVKSKGANGFRKANSRAALGNMNQNRYSKLSSRKTDYLYDADQGAIEVYDPQVRHILVEAVFQRPTDIPTYNPLKDRYPLSDELIGNVFDLISNGVLSRYVEIPSNKISNSQQDLELQKTPNT